MMKKQILLLGSLLLSAVMFAMTACSALDGLDYAGTDRDLTPIEIVALAAARSDAEPSSEIHIEFSATKVFMLQIVMDTELFAAARVRANEGGVYALNFFEGYSISGGGEVQENLSGFFYSDGMVYTAGIKHEVPFADFSVTRNDLDEHGMVIGFFDIPLYGNYIEFLGSNDAGNMHVFEFNMSGDVIYSILENGTGVLARFFNTFSTSLTHAYDDFRARISIDTNGFLREVVADMAFITDMQGFEMNTRANITIKYVSFGDDVVVYLPDELFDFELRPFQNIAASAEAPPTAQLETPAVPAVPADTADITVLVNGVQMLFTNPPLERHGFTFFQVDDILEALADSVSWNAETSTISGALGNNLVEVQIRDLIYIVNGTVFDSPPELAPFVENGLIYVYIDFIIEGLGLSASWDGETRTFGITN